MRSLIQTQPKKACLVISLIYILAWLPYYFTYFPGIVTYDEMVCIRQALGDSALSNHHPIIFVFYLKAVIKAVTFGGGTIPTAVAVATGLQMLFIALVLGYTTCFLVSKNNHPWFYICVCVFFAFSPVIAIFSVSLSKDTFFTGWMILYILWVYNISVEGYLHRKGIKISCLFGFLTFMIAMSRSNGLYVAILMLPVLLLLIKENRKTILFTGIIVFVLIGVIKGPVFEKMNIAESPRAEAFSIPLQQIGCTLSKGGKIGLSDLKYLNDVLPIEDWKNSYTVGITDPLKFHSDFDGVYLNETAGRFLGVWARNLVPNFKYYVQAYLGQIKGYWDITYIVNVGSTDIADNSYGIVQTDCIESVTGVSLKPICALLVLVARKLPIVNFITNQAFLALIYLVAWVVWMKRKEYGAAVAVLPLLIQWLTLLIAAPASSELRYMLSFHFMLPFIIGMFYLPQKRIDFKIRKKDKNHG